MTAISTILEAIDTTIVQDANEDAIRFALSTLSLFPPEESDIREALENPERRKEIAQLIKGYVDPKEFAEEDTTSVFNEDDLAFLGELIEDDAPSKITEDNAGRIIATAQDNPSAIRSDYILVDERDHREEWLITSAVISLQSGRRQIDQFGISAETVGIRADDFSTNADAIAQELLDLLGPVPPETPATAEKINGPDPDQPKRIP